MSAVPPVVNLPGHAYWLPLDRAKHGLDGPPKHWKGHASLRMIDRCHTCGQWQHPKNPCNHEKHHVTSHN